MEERKQSLKRTESRTSTHSRANSVKWKDRVFSPAFHDVQIEQVQIIEPASSAGQGADQKSERRSDGGRSSAGLNVVAPPPSEEGSLGTNNSEERRAFRESYLYQASERVPSRHNTPKTNVDEHETSRREQRHAPSVPLVSLPLDPPGTVISRERSRTRQQSRQRQSIVEQRQRQKVAILRHMQRLQTNESPQQRRLLSGNIKKTHSKRYYEVSPGILLSELPFDENPPQTAPGIATGQFSDSMLPIYEKRANTAPHITKSIIWTAKNRVASSGAVSSISSKWKEDECSDMEQKNRANIFVKMPFKQCPCLTMNQEKQEDILDDIVMPGYELRLTTAFTVSRVKRGIRKLEPPSPNVKKSGRLLKAKLKPLYPIKESGRSIYSCHGIQPDGKVAKHSEGYTPSPSRQRELKDKLDKFYEEHRTKKEEFDQRMMRVQSAASRESVHRTSPEPEHAENCKDDYILNEWTGQDEIYDGLSVSNQLDSLHIESGVIF